MVAIELAQMMLSSWKNKTRSASASSFHNQPLEDARNLETETLLVKVTFLGRKRMSSRLEDKRLRKAGDWGTVKLFGEVKITKDQWVGRTEEKCMRTGTRAGEVSEDSMRTALKTLFGVAGSAGGMEKSSSRPSKSVGGLSVLSRAFSGATSRLESKSSGGSWSS